MKTNIAILAVILVTAFGCSSGPSTPHQYQWIAVSETDEFTGQTTKFVTAGTEAWSERYKNITRSGVLYPFAAIHKGEVIVGLRSGGSFRLPAGNVQLRIDDNPAWTITMAENMEIANPALAQVAQKSQTAAKAEEQIAAAIASVQAMTLGGGITPFTAARGDKAKAILKQMLTGRKLIYRQMPIGIGYKPTTGELLMNDSLAVALREIGVDVDAILAP